MPPRGAWFSFESDPPGGHGRGPFMGSGVTGQACLLEGREFAGIELSERYCELADARLAKLGLRV